MPSYYADHASNDSGGDKGKRYTVTGLLSCLYFPAHNSLRVILVFKMNKSDNKKIVRVLPPIDYMEERRMAESLKPNSKQRGADKKAIRAVLVSK